MFVWAVVRDRASDFVCNGCGFGTMLNESLTSAPVTRYFPSVNQDRAAGEYRVSAERETTDRRKRT
jgi:hypothetical protein